MKAETATERFVGALEDPLVVDEKLVKDAVKVSRLKVEYYDKGVKKKGAV